MFYRMSLSLGPLCPSHDETEALYVGEECCRGEVFFSAHHIRGTHCQHSSSSSEVHFGNLVKVVFARFLHCKVTFSSTF